MILYNHHIIRIYHFRFFSHPKKPCYDFFSLVLLKPCEELPTDCPGVVSYAGDVAYSALLCRADLPYPAAPVSAPDGPDGGGEPKSTEAP